MMHLTASRQIAPFCAAIGVYTNSALVGSKQWGSKAS